jgi:multidrug efflux pump subunit AcrA (membrane-fusion protein)
MKKRAIAWGLGAVAFAAIAGVLATSRATGSPDDNGVPLASVQRGDLDLKVYATGELQATHVIVLTAPTVGGGALQITRLLHTGTLVQTGDMVFEFDPAEQRYKLEQSASELLQAEQEIAQAKADAAVQAAKDKVDLLRARFEQRRAELELQKNELLGVIDARKNELALKQAVVVLAKLQQDVESHTASGEATILLAQEKRNKAKLAMDQARQNIQKMLVASPMNGLVAIERNVNAMGESGWRGMSLPDYRAGDQVEPGSAIAQVLDAGGMELTAKIGERERGNVEVGKSADVEFDALPAQIFHGTVKTVGGMSTRQFWEANTEGGFEITIQLSTEDLRLRPGLTANIVIFGDKKRNVFYVPRQAIFLKDGKRVVYVKNGKGFEQRDIKVPYENESRAVVEGLQGNTQVALLDPTAPRQNGESSTSAINGVTP